MFPCYHIVKEAHSKEKENACRSVKIVCRSWPFLGVEIHLSKDCFINFEQKPQQTSVIVNIEEVFVELHQEVEHKQDGDTRG